MPLLQMEHKIKRIRNHPMLNWRLKDLGQYEDSFDGKRWLERKNVLVSIMSEVFTYRWEVHYRLDQWYRQVRREIMLSHDIKEPCFK